MYNIAFISRKYGYSSCSTAYVCSTALCDVGITKVSGLEFPETEIYTKSLGDKNGSILSGMQTTGREITIEFASRNQSTDIRKTLTNYFCQPHSYKFTTYTIFITHDEEVAYIPFCILESLEFDSASKCGKGSLTFRSVTQEILTKMRGTATQSTATGVEGIFVTVDDDCMITPCEAKIPTTSGCNSGMDDLDNENFVLSETLSIDEPLDADSCYLQIETENSHNHTWTYEQQIGFDDFSLTESIHYVEVVFTPDGNISGTGGLKGTYTLYGQNAMRKRVVKLGETTSDLALKVLAENGSSEQGYQKLYIYMWYGSSPATTIDVTHNSMKLFGEKTGI